MEKDPLHNLYHRSVSWVQVHISVFICAFTVKENVYLVYT